MNTKKELFSTIQKLVGESDSAREIHAKSRAAHKEVVRHVINASDREIVDATKTEIAELKNAVEETADAKKQAEIAELEKKISTWGGFRSSRRFLTSPRRNSPSLRMRRSSGGTRRPISRTWIAAART